MKKKISLPIAVAIALLTAAVAFSVAYISATKSMNKKLTDLGEKQAMFSTLTDVDSYVREKSYFDADEDTLTQSLVEGYVNGYEGRVLLLTAEQYKGSEYEKSEYTKMNVADGCVVVILNEEQYTALAPNTGVSDTEPEPSSAVAE